ncbi:ABC transporter ATP-binding protein [Flavobacterium aquicola]|uniref:Lipopolysaccharide transport system ATP-binding protein n=1 Tax=Flavobacterium aquicola TaxID=1682742 RepID=A0A3E0EKH8_9FLAO|nr:ABC transporter ATP-binding protein [Flavobacterium aquicola]REG98260.1 lipopolysaccharide transport system ATP-binding protein [Flavobacterium aquicola]
MGEVLIKVDHVSKKFAKDLKKSLLYGLSDVFSVITGKKQKKLLRKDEFWAVKDISFEVRRGECLGLIGHNGAGKSTLLKILNGLIAPDEGSVTMYGKVGALIELGAGFNPILTGRENIYNNAAIIGFTKKEIAAKFDEIVAFAELAEFIDMPVQNYSSGMKVRLGFAIAAQMEPDILIIDEVLAVGDVNFRAKCYDRMSELMKNCCVIFVSHSMPQISKVCTWSILIEKGIIKAEGENGKIIEAYYDYNYTEDKPILIFSEGCTLEKFSTVQRTFKGEINKLKIDIEIISQTEIKNIDVSIFLMSRELVPICQSNSKLFDEQIILKKGKNQLAFMINKIYLNSGIYNFALTIEGIDTKKHYLWIQNLNSIQVINEYTLGSPIIIDGRFKN